MKILRYVLIIFLIGIICFLGINIYILQSTKNTIVTDPELTSVIIVLGAGLKPDGTPSDVLRDRLKVGIKLYKEGKGTKLLFSGDNGQVRYDEVNAMRVFALSQDIPEEDIFLDHAGFDTYDTMYRARRIFGVTDAIVVTQDFHLPRALYVAEALGIQVQGVSADLQPYLSRTQQYAREWLARPKIFIDILFGAKSKYLGDSIDITGDGRLTWDEF